MPNPALELKTGRRRLPRCKAKARTVAGWVLPPNAICRVPNRQPGLRCERILIAVTDADANASIGWIVFVAVIFPLGPCAFA